MKKRSFRVSRLAGWWALSCLLVASPSLAEELLPRGSVIPEVRCLEDPAFSYSLYLPSRYDPEKDWPVIYAFSPSGRGEIPVRLLAEAAELHGYIVVGSNDVKNGPWEPVLAAQRVLWKEVNSRFSIDGGRSYATGFSGGARAALELAFSHGQSFAGVILCGGAVHPFREYPRRGDLAVYGLVGDRDLNLEEYLGAEPLFSARGYVHWLEVFEGDHRWPDPPQFMQALEFLEVVAMRRGLRARNQRMSDRMAADRLAKAKSLEEAGSTLLALSGYRQIERFFSEHEVGGEARAAIERILAQPGTAEALEQEKGFREDLAALRDWTDLKRFRAASAELRRRMASDDALGERSRTALSRVASDLGQVGLRLLREDQIEDAVAYLSIAAATYPENPVAAYNAACAFARQGDIENGIKLLRMAAANRFADLELLRTDADLDPLREHPDFPLIESAVSLNREVSP